MSWSDPSGHVYAVGEVLTAATMNTYVKDNLIDLDRRATITTASVATSQTTTSASYVDLATAGPAVTVTIGANGRCMVFLSASQSNSSAGADAFMGFAVSGASTVAALDAKALAFTSATAGQGVRHGIPIPVTGLTPGSNTFTAKYRCTSGTAAHSDRNISVIPAGS